MFDQRGTGLSDRPAADAMPSLELRMDDAQAVMDAVGSEAAFVLGISEGGPLSLMLAATFPDRVRGLILFVALNLPVGRDGLQPGRGRRGHTRELVVAGQTASPPRVCPST